MNQHLPFQFAWPIGLFFLLLRSANLIAQTCTGNLLTNPGFENNLNNWNPQGNVTAITSAHSGTKAARLGGTGYASIGQAFPAAPGTSYTAKLWARNAGSIQMRFLNAAWQEIPGATGHVNPYLPDYNELTMTKSAPAGAVYVYLIAFKDANLALEVDDFCLTVGGEPCSITASVSNVSCFDNGTADNPSDDRIVFTLNTSHTGQGTGYQAFAPLANQAYTGIYGVPLVSQELFISDGPQTVILNDNVYQSCQTFVTVVPPAPCSNGGSPANLVITNVPCPANYPDWTQPYIWGVTVQNNGGTASQESPIYLYNYAPQAMGYTAKLLATGNVPALAAGQSTTISLTAPASVHSPNPGSAGYGQDFLLSGQKGLSFTQVASGNAPLFNETNGFPSIYCKKFSTDLVVDVASTMTTVAPTQPLVFTVKVTNNGPVDAYNVSSGLHAANSGTPNQPSFSAQVTAGQVWQQNQAAGGGTNTSFWGWYIPFLAVGQSATATVTLTPVAGGTTWPSTGQTFMRSANSGHNMDTNLANNNDQVTIYGSNTGGPGQIDLSLAAQQLTATPAQWSSYPVKLTLSNTGPQAATGVKVKFAKPTGVVYLGGNQFTASQGTFNPNGDEVWTVGSIPANGSATLTVNYFLLATTAPVAYAQVTAANETDVDSQPNNGTPPTPEQDDEASTSGGTPPPAADFVATPSSIISFGISQISGSTPSRRFGFYFVGQNTGVAVPVGPGATPVTVGFYLSSDNALSTSDHAIGTFTLSSSNGITFGNQADLQPISDNVPGGTYYLIAKMDEGNLFEEPNETNNVAVYGSQVVLPTVTGQQPDLTIADLQVSTPSVAPGAILSYNFDASNVGTGAVPGNFTIKSYISTDQTLSANDIQDGTIPTGNYAAGFSVQNVAGASTIPTNLAAGQYHLIVKIDADNSVVEGNENNNVVVKPLTVTAAGGGGTPNCNSITITPGANKITIAGFSAPHVLIKVFRPNWTVAYECLDGACSNPLVVSGLGAGSHFVEVKLLNTSWGEICKKTQTVNVSSFGGGNGSDIVKQEDDRFRLSFDKFYPNPTAYLTTMELFSPKSQAATLDFYNQQGRLVHTMKADLKEGINTIEAMVYDWKSGTYNVIARGEETGLPAYGRFLKVWEE
jgi:hypothetical protein